MPTNNFKAFSVGVGANVITQAAYEALTTLIANGFASGTANSAQLNKVWRQSSIMSAVLAQFISDLTGLDSIDDGTTATLLANLKASTLSPLSRVSLTTVGTVDAIQATFSSPPTAWQNGVPFYVRSAGSNTVSNPTLTLNNGTLTAKTIVKGSNAALAVGDIDGAGFWMLVQYDASLDKVVMLNPTTGTSGSATQIPQNIQSAPYTLVLGDAGKHILHPSADTTARTFTIPANASVAYPIGACITFVNQNAAGVVTIAITSDTMRLAGAGTTGSRTLAANGIATALKITNTEWIISGTGLS